VWRKCSSYIKSSDVIDWRTLRSKAHACSNIALLPIFTINDQLVQNPLKVQTDVMTQMLLFCFQMSLISVMTYSNHVTRHGSDLFLCVGANCVCQIKGLQSFYSRCCCQYLKQCLLAWVSTTVLCRLLMLWCCFDVYTKLGWLWFLFCCGMSGNAAA